MEKLIMKNKIPYQYFITKGFGESDIAIHAGSYHLSLKKAGIEKYNIMTYSSILPKEAEEIAYTDNLSFGSVMDTIMSSCSGNKGELLCAGIGIGFLYDKNGNKYGGLVVEHNGSYNNDEIHYKLNASLNENISRVSMSRCVKN